MTAIRAPDRERNATSLAESVARRILFAALLAEHPNLSKGLDQQRARLIMPHGPGPIGICIKAPSLRSASNPFVSAWPLGARQRYAQVGAEFGLKY
jgi:hypothetical protein